jgi:hypothetical protein
MKLSQAVFPLLTLFLVSGCQWFGEGDLLEVFFGVRDNTSSIDKDTLFFYENEDDLTFSTSSEVFLRFDFLYIPEDQNLDQAMVVELRFPDVDDYFLSPVIGADLDSSIDASEFVYELPLNKNQYTSFFFTIEVLNPTIVLLEISAAITMEQVNANPLNQELFTSEDNESQVVKKGKNLKMNQLHFQEIESSRGMKS